MNPLKLLFRTQSTSATQSFLKISEEVSQALLEKKGVVALESTIIAHGMPYPLNIRTAKDLEEIVRFEGAVPATIALLDGKIQVGLSEDNLDQLAKSNDVMKVTRRDMARCLVSKSLGATTVASTMWAANQAGIKVFATGGIGGVHRYADQTFDISADLQELASTPVTVVCAGVKSILDIPKTVEYLETHSVNTIVYSDRNVFPSFFTRHSDAKGQFNTIDLTKVAKIVELSKQMGLPAGTILACPIPEEYETDGRLIEKAIRQALEIAKSRNVTGPAATPFLLSKVKELTDGRSLQANMALVRNNTKIAARLANIMATNQRRSTGERSFITTSSKTTGDSGNDIPRVVSIGAAICDYEAITDEDLKDDGGSYRGIVTQRPGGVARNHADVLARLGLKSSLLTFVGDDENGEFIRRKCQHIDLSRVETIPKCPTATYFSINKKGNVLYGISSIEGIMQRFRPEMIKQNRDLIGESKFLLLDGNSPVETIKAAIEKAVRLGVPVWYEPTDKAKMRKLFETKLVDRVTVTSPNLNEFRELCQYSGATLTANDTESTSALRDFINKNEQLLHRFKILIVTMGEKGVIVCTKESNDLHIITVESPLENKDIVSVSGSGDCWNGGFLAGWLLGKSLEDRIEIAQKCAKLSLKSMEAVPIDIPRIV